MTTRTPGQVYQDLVNAGFSPAAAVTMTEIAGAESGFNDAAVGDTSLEDSTWGPSFGLFQIRTTKSSTGSGGDRDISALTGDDVAQAQAAYAISQSGANFSPWSTWTSGKYQDFAATVTKALGLTPAGSSTTVTPVDNPGPYDPIGPSWLPWNWVGDAYNAATAKTQSEFSGVRTIVVESLFAGLGLALVGLGVYGLSGDRITRVKNKVNAVGQKAGQAAMLAA